MEGGIGLVGLVGLCPYLNKNWQGENAINSHRSEIIGENFATKLF